MVATLGASMVAMVGNLTLANKKYEEFKDQAQGCVDRVMGMIAKLKDLTIKDMEAFDAYMGVFKMPKDTEEEKAARKQAMENAAKRATLVPLDICKTCLDIVSEADGLSKYGNLMAISDVGVGAMVAEAALRSCMLSVDIKPAQHQGSGLRQGGAGREGPFVHPGREAAHPGHGPGHREDGRLIAILVGLGGSLGGLPPFFGGNGPGLRGPAACDSFAPCVRVSYPLGGQRPGPAVRILAV